MAKKFDFDKAQWQWESACDIYCKQFNKEKTKLTEEDNNIIFNYGANHISFFLTWLIDNDFLSPLHRDEKNKDIDLVKNRKMTGFEYLQEYCDLVLSREDMARKIVKFSDYFYDDYIYEYCNAMEKDLGREVLGCCFDWKDYEYIRKNVIDVAYGKFLEEKKKK